MGRKPLVGLMGLLGVSVLVTGCNCTRQNGKQAFMNERADSSLGVTRNLTSGGWNNKSQNSVAGNPASSGPLSGSPVSSSGDRGLDSMSASSTGMGGGMGSPMGGASPMSGASPMGGSMGSPMGGASPMTGGAGMPTMSSSHSIPGVSMAAPPSVPGSSLTESMPPLPPGPAGNSLAAGSSPMTGNIKTTSNRMSDPSHVTTADFKMPSHSADTGVRPAAMTAEDTGREVVPPTPPMTALTSPPPLPSSSAAAIKQYPPAPPVDAPPSMTGTDPALNNPAPAVNAPTTPPISSSTPKPSPASALPDYLRNP